MGIFKRGKTYWYNFWWNGRHVQRSTKQGNPRVARQMEAAFKTQLAKGEVGLKAPEPVPVFADFAKDFLSWAEITFKAKPKTFAYYRSGLRKLLCYSPIAGAKLDEITGDVVPGYIAHRQRQGRRVVERVPANDGTGKVVLRRITRPLTVTGLNRELQVLRRMLRLGFEWGKTPKAAKIRMLPGERGREHVVSAAEEHEYLANALEPLYSIAIVLIGTGMRPEECFRLRWEHVQFNKGDNGAVFVTHGKTAAARRSIPMAPAVRRALTELWEEAGKPSSGYVFVADTRSGHVEPSTIRGLHRKAIEAAKGRPFVLYAFRHTFLTRLGASGCDVWTLARVAGHSSLTISARYVHPSDATVQTAFKKMNEIKSLPETTQTPA